MVNNLDLTNYNRLHVDNSVTVKQLAYSMLLCPITVQYDPLLLCSPSSVQTGRSIITQPLSH